MKKGREGRDKFGSSKGKKTRSGGTTNKEKRRNKPMLMSVKSRKTSFKQDVKASQKIANVRKHISNLKKKKCAGKRRR